MAAGWHHTNPLRRIAFWPQVVPGRDVFRSSQIRTSMNGQPSDISLCFCPNHSALKPTRESPAVDEENDEGRGRHYVSETKRVARTTNNPHMESISSNANNAAHPLCTFCRAEALLGGRARKVRKGLVGGEGADPHRV